MCKSKLHKCASVSCNKRVKEGRDQYCSRECFLENRNPNLKVGWIWVENEITKSIMNKIRFDKRLKIRKVMEQYEGKPVTLIIKFD